MDQACWEQPKNCNKKQTTNDGEGVEDVWQQQLDKLSADLQILQSLQSLMLTDDDQGQKRGISSAETCPSLRLRVT